VSRNFAFAKVANSRLKDVDGAASGETAPENRRRLIVTRGVMAFFMFVNDTKPRFFTCDIPVGFTFNLCDE
jgi:hypothetical protein